MIREDLGMAGECAKCGTALRPGVYLRPYYSGIPDFPGGEVVTMSPAPGSGTLVSCMKCPSCGWSRTRTAEEEKARWMSHSDNAGLPGSGKRGLW